MKWHLQIEPGTWVLWGYGPGRQVVHVDRAKIDLPHGLDPIPFKLPKESVGGGRPQEYERRKGYGWRWNSDEAMPGHSWNFVDTIDEAVEAATQDLEHMRVDTRKKFTAALRDVRVGGKKYK